MVIHRIRLNTQWRLKNAEGFSVVNVPTQLASAKTNLIRAFGKPTNLGEQDRLFFVVDHSLGNFTLSVNGTERGRWDSAGVRIELQDLFERNEAVLIATPSQPGEEVAIGNVRIEIENSAIKDEA